MTRTQRTIPFKGLICTGILATGIMLNTGCKKNSTPPDPSVRTTLSQYVSVDGKGIYYVTDLPGDTSATASGAAKTVYFSLTTNGTVTPASPSATSWDLAFNNLYNSYVSINSGTNMYSPGYGGQGQGAVWVVNQPFDSVKTVPAAAAMDSIGSVGMEGYPTGWVGWYAYNQTTHILTPIGGRTLVIRTATGKYARLSMITLYKGNPANPTLSTPVPYLSFKYQMIQ